MKKITVHDKMQDGHTYTLTEPAGKNFADDFKPELTPKEMLALGVFGGIYMRDCIDEFPKSWFANAKFAEGKKREKMLNFFQVNASQPLAEWRRKGWINNQDPRGWFQWYCRYYMGRRSDDDIRQIKRWKNMTRHTGQIKKYCRPGELDCRRGQRQAVLHWAYDSRKI